MELFLIGENGTLSPASGVGAKRNRKKSTRVAAGVGLGKTDSSSSLREEIRLMLYLSSRIMEAEEKSVSKKEVFSDSLASRCA